MENTTKGAGKLWKTTGDVWYEPCIPERFCGCDSLLRGTISSICSFTFTFTAVFVFMFIATCGLTAQDQCQLQGLNPVPVSSIELHLLP